jgi:hypothetical protein
MAVDDFMVDEDEDVDGRGLFVAIMNFCLQSSASEALQARDRAIDSTVRWLT